MLQSRRAKRAESRRRSIRSKHQPNSDARPTCPISLRVGYRIARGKGCLTNSLSQVGTRVLASKRLPAVPGLNTSLIHPFSTMPSGQFWKELRSKRMKPSTKDQIKGNLHEVKGKVKETAGQVTNNPNLAAEGQDENLAGKVQKKVGQVEKVFEK